MSPDQINRYRREARANLADSQSGKCDYDSRIIIQLCDELASRPAPVPVQPKPTPQYDEGPCQTC